MEVFGRSFQISPYFLKISIKKIFFSGFSEITFSENFLSTWLKQESVLNGFPIFLPLEVILGEPVQTAGILCGYV